MLSTLGKLGSKTLIFFCFSFLTVSCFGYAADWCDEEGCDCEWSGCDEFGFRQCDACDDDNSCNACGEESEQSEDCDQECSPYCHTNWSCNQLYYRDWYCCQSSRLWGEWLPEAPPLFRPFMADPRQVTYSVGWRFNDNALRKNEAPISFGDTVYFYRVHNLQIGPFCGDLQVELEGCIWAVFDPTHDYAPLINADYYVGVPITYAFDRWQFRLRGYHISSHLGDEYMLLNPHLKRKNPSAEYIDFFISHDISDEIRLYAGLGYIVSQDNSFRFHRFYQEMGFELRMARFGFYSPCQKLYGEPILGVHMRHRGDFKRHVDMTYILGYEFGKLCGLRRRLRAYMEYHDGYSLEGQFSRRATNYFALRLTYGF